MKPAALFAIPALLALAACGSSSAIEEKKTDLRLACKTLPCECRENIDGMFVTRKTTDLLWNDKGDPSCPAGYRLHVTGFKQQ
jgi:hypothetical protein